MWICPALAKVSRQELQEEKQVLNAYLKVRRVTDKSIGDMLTTPAASVISG